MVRTTSASEAGSLSMPLLTEEEGDILLESEMMGGGGNSSNDAPGVSRLLYFSGAIMIDHPRTARHGGVRPGAASVPGLLNVQRVRQMDVDIWTKGARNAINPEQWPGTANGYVGRLEGEGEVEMNGGFMKEALRQLKLNRIVRKQCVLTYNRVR